MGVLAYISPEKSSLDSIYSWFIAICGCVYLVFNVGYGMSSGVIFVLVQERYDVTKQIASYPMNTFATLACVFSCLSGPIHHRLKTRKTLILGTVLGMVGSCLSVFRPWNDAVTWLTVCMAVRGIGCSLTFPPIYQVVSTHFEKHLAKAFMVLSANSSISGLILPSIVVISAEKYGLESSWLIHASLYCQTLLLAAIIRPRRHILPQTNKARDPITEEERNSLLQVKPDVATTNEDSFKTILFDLLREKNFYALCFFYNMTVATNIAFRMTIVDYGIDTNLEPRLNKYILEVLAFVDLARIPTALFLDSKLCYVETLISLASVFMALTIFLLTLTSNVVYVLVACLFSTFYAVSNACVVPGLAHLGTNKIAVSMGFSTATLALAQFCLPFLIGLSRDFYGSYNYLYYLFAVVNLFVALLFGWTRKNDWFKHRK